MEIEEARCKLNLLQEHIENALDCFSEETGLEVENVYIENVYKDGKRMPVHQVLVDVTLTTQFFRPADLRKEMKND